VVRAPRILLALREADRPRAATALDGAGLQVRTRSASGPLAHDIATFRPDLVILDGVDPASLAVAVSQTHAASHPFVLCVVDGAKQWVPALEAGADACLEKPYSVHELLVSVRALVRRAPWLLRTVHRVAGLVIDEDAHIVLFDDDPITLSKKEFGILVMLARHRGMIVSKRALLDELWGYDTYDENLVEVQVSGLRRQLPSSAANMIQTVRGVGYVLRGLAPAAAPRAG